MAASRVASGVADGALLSGVRARDVVAGPGSILVNVTARRVDVAPGCVVYNVVTEGDVVLTEPGSVLTTAYLEAGATEGGATEGGVEGAAMASRTDLDGGTEWKRAVCGNARSFEEVYHANGDADVGAMEAHALALHAAAAAKLGL